MTRLSTILIDDLSPGTKLHEGKYEILKKISQGGFGYTYLAKHIEMDSNLVIKEFYLNGYVSRKGNDLEPHTGSEGLYNLKKDEFINEARTLNNLRHENIVVVHDVFQENNTAYYTMDYVKGLTLFDFVQEKRKQTNTNLSPDTILEWIKQLSNGLNYIHDRKVLHADISPMNILVNEHEQLILIDFGQAFHYDENGMTKKMPVLAHTRGYTAPEMGDEESMIQFHPQTDLFSFAAVIYYCLTGEHPKDLLPGDTCYEKPNINSSKEKKAENAEEEILWNWIRSCTAYDYKQRPENINESLKLLQDTSDPNKDANIHKDKKKNKIRWVIGILSLFIVFGFFEWVYTDKYDISTYKFKAIPAQETYIKNMPVLIPAFMMGEIEVTNKMYYGSTLKTMLLAGKCENPYIVKDSISILEYCNQLSKKEGYEGFYQKNGDEYVLLKNSNGYRLPLEAEWSIAVSLPANLTRENGIDETDYETTRNAFGIKGLYGNMFELCHNAQGNLVCCGSKLDNHNEESSLTTQSIPYSEEKPDSIGFRLVLIE